MGKNEQNLVKKTAEYVKQKMLHESTGHDWWHVLRVWTMAKRLAASYPQADLEQVELAALLHDLGDYKITGSSEAEERVLRAGMADLEFSAELTTQILGTIEKVSFSKNVGSKQVLTLEAQIVQDADRLDSLGAIGIARVFAYGGKTGRAIYDPTQKVQIYKTTEQRRKSMSSSILHFDEKLFLIKDMLHTDKAKEIGVKRHTFMKDFLREFHREWNGID